MEFFSSIFENCFELKEIDVSNFDTSNEREIEGMFHNCYEIKKLDLFKFNIKKIKNLSFYFYNIL